MSCSWVIAYTVSKYLTSQCLWIQWKIVRQQNISVVVGALSILTYLLKYVLVFYRGGRVEVVQSQYKHHHHHYGDIVLTYLVCSMQPQQPFFRLHPWSTFIHSHWLVSLNNTQLTPITNMIIMMITMMPMMIVLATWWRAGRQASTTHFTWLAVASRQMERLSSMHPSYTHITVQSCTILT